MLHGTLTCLCMVSIFALSDDTFVPSMCNSGSMTIDAKVTLFAVAQYELILPYVGWVLIIYSVHANPTYTMKASWVHMPVKLFRRLFKMPALLLSTISLFPKIFHRLIIITVFVDVHHHLIKEGDMHNEQEDYCQRVC